MIRRFLPLLLVAAATAQAADPAARYVSRQTSRPAPARQTTTTTVSTAPLKVQQVQQVQQVQPAEQVTVVEQTVLIPANEPRLLETANVLPLALDDAFEFRKQKVTFFSRDRRREVSRDAMARFERDRITYGALSLEEQNKREGHYFVFWWRNQRPANLTVRLEYRQANLGNLVQARELDFSVPKGTHKTKFEVIGDDFHDDGTVTAWRALLIEDNKIVASKQSFLWH